MEPELDIGVSSQQGTPPPRRKGGCGRLLLFVVLFGLMLLPVLVYFTDAPGKVKRGLLDIIQAYKEEPEPVTKTVKETVVVEKILEIPPPLEPLPSDYVTARTIDTARLYNGFSLKSVLDIEKGANASLERGKPEGYEIQLQVSVKVPKASQTIEEFSKLNPHLPKLLPDLPALLETSRVSGFYHKLYEIKGRRLQKYLTRLESLPTRHDYYDCESILELKHPETGKRALLLQGEMDVVSDGTDGDRMAALDDYISKSANFQPFTSYGWPKQTSRANPLLARWEENLKKTEEEYAVKGLSAGRNRDLRARIEKLKREIRDLKARSFLIGQMDPFMVLPLSLLGYEKINSYGLKMGDYAVIIHEDRVFPVIVGDAGPSFKMGEASLRMATALSEKASPYNRPESNLKVTYLVFPGSADAERGPPDFDAWHARCLELLQGIGGLGEGVELHRWKDLLKPEEKEAEPPESVPEASAAEGEGAGGAATTGGTSG